MNINVTLSYGTGNTFTTSFVAGITLASVLTDSRVKAALGFSKNVEGYLDGIPQPGHVVLEDGDEVEIHDKACEKAHAVGADSRVTIRYGTGNELTRVVPAGTTVGQLLGQPDVKAALGYGKNVEGYIDGVPQSNTTILEAHDLVEIHDKACEKAA